MAVTTADETNEFAPLDVHVDGIRTGDLVRVSDTPDADEWAAGCRGRVGRVTSIGLDINDRAFLSVQVNGEGAHGGAGCFTGGTFGPLRLVDVTRVGEDEVPTQDDAPFSTFYHLQRVAWCIAEEKGFHEGRSGDGRDDTLVRLCLVHTEISEAAQEVKRHWDGRPTEEQRAAFGEELADSVIRLLDLAECVGVNLQVAVLRKMATNRARPRRYGTANSEAGQ